MKTVPAKLNLTFPAIATMASLLMAVALLAQDGSPLRELSDRPQTGQDESVTWNSQPTGPRVVAPGMPPPPPVTTMVIDEEPELTSPSDSAKPNTGALNTSNGSFKPDSFTPETFKPSTGSLQKAAATPPARLSSATIDANRNTPPSPATTQPAPTSNTSPPKANSRPGSTPPKTSPPIAGANSTNKQVGTTEFTLAAQPKPGAHAKFERPQTDRFANTVEPHEFDFAPTPVFQHEPYDASSEIWVYEGKTLNANRRPLIELGRPWYQLGQMRPSSTIFGSHNPAAPQFLIYGDYRMAYASNNNGGDHTSQVAFEANLNFDLRLTGTERLTAFIAPLDKGNNNTRWLTDDDQFVEEFDVDVDFGMFEGDLGAIVGGATGQTLPFDLPFAVGVMPMLVQNGVWMEDAILGIAATIPARNSPALDISNMDITFFAAYDNINSPAFDNDEDAAKMYGVLSFIEAMGGYFEIDYAFLEDRDIGRDRGYHNIGMAYSRRYGRFISNSLRVIVNAGQSTDGGPNTADGTLVLLENSLITSRPQTFVPYFNLFAGFDRPQSAARAADAGGVLRNTGILFESDGMTGYPTLDATANDTWGGAIGLNILAENFDQQLILEVAALNTMGNDATRRAVADQYGVGARYQIPLSNSWLIRSDAMYGFLREIEDIHGVRFELRHKF